MENILPVMKALSDSNRLRIVAALMENNELCACQINALLEIKGASTSRHLSLLVRGGIIKSRKDGRWIYYRIDRNKAPNILLNWIKKEISDSKEFNSDRKAISKILADDVEDICRKQRGEKCCPKRK